MRVLTCKVLVMGEDTRAFLSVVRSLGRAGLEVHTAGCASGSPSFYSRYIHQSHSLPGPDSPDWLDRLKELLGSQDFDLVVPCCDPEVLALHSRRGELRGWNFAIPRPEAFDLFFDKRQTYELARSLDIPVPRQAEVSGLDEVEELAGRFGLPLVLKPSSSVAPEKPGVRRAVRKIRSIYGLPAIAGPLLADGPVSVQENFVGIGIGVEVLCREGEILFAFQHERVHEPLEGGGSSYRRSVPLSDDLLEATRQLMRAASYTGVAMVEFKRDTRSGKWVLIEVNSRFWGSLPLALAAGADFPRFLYDMEVCGRRKFPRSYRSGIYCRNWRIDARWMVSNLLADRTDRTLMTRPLWKVLLEPLHLLHERSDTLTWDDPGPALAELRQCLRQELVRLVWMLPPVRWNLRRRVRNALTSARRILFVCQGNICRSPFAEAFARTRLPAGLFEVDSGGLLPYSGRECPPQARNAAREFGIDLSLHRSKTLQASQVQQADVILVFDQNQKRVLQGRFPESSARICYVGALDNQRDPVIQDPWGREPSEFAKVYRRIQEALEQATSMLITQASANSV